MLISPKIFSKNSFWTLIFRSQIFYHRVSVIIVSISYVQQRAYKERGKDGIGGSWQASYFTSGLFSEKN